MSVVDRYRCHLGVSLLMRTIASFLRYTGYLNVINDPLWYLGCIYDNGYASCFLDLIVCKCHNDYSHIAKQFEANEGRLNSQITKLLHELHSTYTFHDQVKSSQNMCIFAFKMLLTRSSDMSKFAVTT